MWGWVVEWLMVGHCPVGGRGLGTAWREVPNLTAGWWGTLYVEKKQAS